MDAALKMHGLTVAGGGAFGGASLWIEAPPNVDTEVLAKNLHQKSVLIEPGRPFFDKDAAAQNFYRIAYSSISSDRIEPGVALIAQVQLELT